MFNTKTLDTEAEQVRITWSRYRGGRGTYIGVTGRTYIGVSGQRSCPGQTCAGNSRDSSLIEVLYKKQAYNISYSILRVVQVTEKQQLGKL